MSDLRDLIIDLRIELRKLKPDFQRTELRQRMDEAVSLLGRLPDASLEAILRASGAPRSMADLRSAPASVAAAAPVEAAPPDPQTTVWREVVHDLRATHPAVFEMIQREVHARLGTAASDGAAAPHAADAAKSAPASADAAAPPVVAAATASSFLSESASDVPSENLLRLVADGLHTLTDRQREWCMGEAMVLLAFQLSPDELLGRGDPALARAILHGTLDD